MLITTDDLRLEWWRLASKPVLDAADVAVLARLPSGARQAPLPWLVTTRIDRRGHFDKDEQGEVFSDHTIVTGWRDALDPCVHRAGALSFYAVDLESHDVLLGMPDHDLGPGITALTLEGRHVFPTALAHAGRSRAWKDLAIHGAHAFDAALGVGELAEHFPGLLGLELHRARLNDDVVEALTRAAFFPHLLDLTLPGTALSDHAACSIAAALGSLIHLDLQDTRLTTHALRALAPKLTRARRLQLSSCPIGDDGLRALAEAGALEHVEDLWLSSCELSDASATLLVEADPPALGGLWMSGNHLTDAGIEALVRAPLFARLSGAHLHQHGLGERSRALLAGHPLERSLRGTTRYPGVGAWWFLGR